MFFMEGKLFPNTETFLKINFWFSDHFTILFSLTGQTPTEAGSTFSMYHWNGLPPLGPRMALLDITAKNGQKKASADQFKPTFYKPEKGEIDGKRVAVVVAISWICALDETTVHLKF